MILHKSWFLYDEDGCSFLVPIAIIRVPGPCQNRIFHCENTKNLLNFKCSTIARKDLPN